MQKTCTVSHSQDSLRSSHSIVLHYCSSPWSRTQCDPSLTNTLSAAQGGRNQIERNTCLPNGSGWRVWRIAASAGHYRATALINDQSVFGPEESLTYLSRMSPSIVLESQLGPFPRAMLERPDQERHWLDHGEVASWLAFSFVPSLLSPPSSTVLPLECGTTLILHTTNASLFSILGQASGHTVCACSTTFPCCLLLLADV